MGKSRDDDNKLKRSSPSSPGRRDEERRIKKRKDSKEEDEKLKSKKHKSHKSSNHRSDRGEKSGEKHKDKNKRKHARSSKIKIQEISSEDYFAKNNEFATWLKKERKIFFSDLSSESARGLFAEFVEEWNNEELEDKYYEGISTAPRTAHKWNLKK